MAATAPMPATAPMSKEDKRMQTALGADADQMFGKNRMKEDGFDVDGDGQIEDEELLDLQRLNYMVDLRI